MWVITSKKALRRCVFALRFGIFAFYTILDLELLENRRLP
jgi:hypothetical protein